MDFSLIDYLDEGACYAKLVDCPKHRVLRSMSRPRDIFPRVWQNFLAYSTRSL